MKLQLGLLIFCLVSTPALAAQASSNPVDMLDFEAVDLEGQAFQGQSLKGKTVLIDFWAVWCAPCIKAFPQLSRLQNELGGDDFQVLGMAAYSGGPEQVKKFLSSREVSYPMLIADVEIVEQFEVIGYPTYFLIDAQGRVQKKLVGELTNLYDEITALVRQHSAGSSSAEEKE